MKVLLYRWIQRHSQWIVAACLFFVPFFWLKPGEMDLGGDSGRLYFYDPVAFIRNISLYHFVPEGLGLAEPNTYYLPYVLLIALLKVVFRSPTFVIGIISGLKLSVGFLAIYGIVAEIIRKTGIRYGEVLAAHMAGIFYVFSPVMLGNYDKAITSHNQVFLNPLMFYLLLKFLVDDKPKYLLCALWVSFVFAPNFALTSAPPFFAFYPIAAAFLLLYTKFILRKMIPWKWVLVGILLFIGIQAFHLLPQVMNLFEPGSFTNTRVFDRTSIMQEGVRYFTAVLPLASVVKDMFMVPMLIQFLWVSVFAPFIILIALFIRSLSRVKVSRDPIWLIACFYGITLFLYAAKLTNTGIVLYKSLYYLPGFSMFRNFIGQWPPVYAFFYALLVGIGMHGVLQVSRLRKWTIYSGVLISVFWIISAMPFLKGDTVNKIHSQSNDVRMTFEMDPRYEEVLSFIRSLPDDGKILTLPLTDAYYQVLAGKNGGAYLGTSTISQLTGKKDFNGYQIFGPFSESMMKYAREKDYVSFTDMLSKFSIRYIFHNTDPNIYESGFPQSPYTYMKTSFPGTQKGYEEFIGHLPVNLIYTNGPYNIYELSEEFRTPELYVTGSVSGRPDKEAGFSVEKLSPVEYRISLDVRESGFLVWNNTYSRQWRLDINGQVLPEVRHSKMNGYANIWQFGADDRRGKTGYTMTLVLDSQKYILWGWVITVVSLFALGAISMRIYAYNRHEKRYI